MVCSSGEFKVVNYPVRRSLKEIYDGKPKDPGSNEIVPEDFCREAGIPVNQLEPYDSMVSGHSKTLCKLRITLFKYAEETFTSDREYQTVSKETLTKIFGNTPLTCDEEKAKKVTAELKTQLEKKLVKILVQAPDFLPGKSGAKTNKSAK